MSRRSVRTERRLFLADGPKAVEAVLARVDEGGPGIVRQVFVTTDALDRFRDILDKADEYGVAVDVVDERAMAALSDSVTPAGVVAEVRFIDVALDAIRGDLLAICADVRDPGNAGTIIRTADAAGAHGVVLAGDSVDAYNSKTVRASVGSLFHVPFAVERDPAVAVRAARDAGLTVLAADGGGEVDLFDADELLTRPTAWVFGNEAWGLPADLASMADHRVRIPILGHAESLNLATAAAVCLYASARAHRH